MLVPISITTGQEAWELLWQHQTLWHPPPGWLIQSLGLTGAEHHHALCSMVQREHLWRERLHGLRGGRWMPAAAVAAVAAAFAEATSATTHTATATLHSRRANWSDLHGVALLRI